MISSGNDLQTHLYQSFLERRTTDVALRISGTWDAVYHLHRVVLIQSGFFRSLFTAGFSESTSSPRSPGRLDELDVVFDDSNISRAAFEICIARLYGGGPQLYISSALRPTLKHPLTPGFPYLIPDKVPEGKQHISSQFLTSLLATSIYLSIPSVASEALSAIYGTFGPHTILDYLNFALGKSASLEHTQEGAVGLETVAEIFDSDEEISSPPSKEKRRRSSSPELISNSPTESFERILNDSVPHETLPRHYGALSDKIGEAASCWLARWGPDILFYEEQVSQKDVLNSHPTIVKSRKRASTVPTGVTESDVTVKSIDLSNARIPLIWRRGGLSPEWIRALISSDSFFVKDERDRYDFAKRVVELRRSECSFDDEEESVWEKIFSQGIYYCNMPPEEIIAISNELSPNTKKPYVNLSVLQAANWSHTLLRHQIMYRPVSPSSGQPNSPKPAENLGLAAPSTSLDGSEASHFLVPTDETLKVGERGGSSSEGKGISMEQLFAHSHSTSTLALDTSPSNSADNYPVTFNESSFFSLTPRPSKSPNAMYSPYPPFRFSVEFFDIDHLKHTDRAYSRTIWYAGSLFNVYLQVVKKKPPTLGEPQSPTPVHTQQLGIYVSRASTVENVPDVSAPNPLTARHPMEVETGFLTPQDPPPPRASTSRTTPVIHHHSSSLSLTSPTRTRPTTPAAATRSTTPDSRSGTPSSLPSYTNLPGTSYRDAFGFPYSLPYKAPGAAPAQPYRDSRPNVMAYFMVYAANPTGTSQTRFMSGPDQFKVGGSWGWKSSSLKDNHDIAPGEGDATTQASKMSLRATVILGVV